MVWQRCDSGILELACCPCWPFRGDSTVSIIFHGIIYTLTCVLQISIYGLHLCYHRNRWCTGHQRRCLRLYPESAKSESSLPHEINVLTAFSGSTSSIFTPGSTSPSAILYDAWESFTKKSPKADESIRSIRPELAKAVDECIDAAGQEWEPHWQRRLLNVCFFIPHSPGMDIELHQAAKFGRGFLDFHNPTDFVTMGQTLKVLNGVRYYEVGIPLTLSQ